ncbi:phosphoribosylglycinamide formyltransferase [Arhodomonas sp. SL1]|uniref:phosphoribosylglycinamide formyltransferase n=1 Tax=Arhodomonas sp. SL1 TaxID=3425691 RepID=UPI003F882784
MTDRRARVVVLISGTGSNLQSLIDAQADSDFPADVVGVISNRTDAHGLQRARAAGIPTEVLPHREHPCREDYDTALAHAIDAYDPDLVVLAGFMRILTPGFVERYYGRLINIHPSLLPAYRGLHTHERALADGVGEHGASVHFVIPELDAGPVIVQARVPVHPDDTPEALKARVQAQEHRIYPLAVRWIAQGRVQLSDDTVAFDGRTDIAAPVIEADTDLSAQDPLETALASTETS